MAEFPTRGSFSASGKKDLLRLNVPGVLAVTGKVNESLNTRLCWQLMVEVYNTDKSGSFPRPNFTMAQCSLSMLCALTLGGFD